MAAVKRRKFSRKNNAKFMSTKSILLAFVVLVITAIIVVAMLLMKQKIINSLPVPTGDRDLYFNHENQSQESSDDSPEYGKHDRDYLEEIIKNH